MIVDAKIVDAKIKIVDASVSQERWAKSQITYMYKLTQEWLFCDVWSLQNDHCIDT